MYQGNCRCVVVQEGGKDGDLDGARRHRRPCARRTPSRHVSMRHRSSEARLLSPPPWISVYRHLQSHITVNRAIVPAAYNGLHQGGAHNILACIIIRLDNSLILCLPAIIRHDTQKRCTDSCITKQALKAKISIVAIITVLPPSRNYDPRQSVSVVSDIRGDLWACLYEHPIPITIYSTTRLSIDELHSFASVSQNAKHRTARTPNAAAMHSRNPLH